jgi:hypothetical protein
MDLALECGSPQLESLARDLSEREFYAWSRYAEQRGGLPMRRIEVLLARLLYAFEVGFMGKKNARLSDYLSSDRERDDEMAEEMESLFAAGGTVVKMRERHG